MLPHEREMVERLKDKPFALLGMNSDQDGPEGLKKKLTENQITWRNSINESTRPIANEWNVTSWPTIFVLDAKGVIRHRDVREKQMEEAVEALLKEVKGK